jgi:hypothetical protein
MGKNNGVVAFRNLPEPSALFELVRRTPARVLPLKQNTGSVCDGVTNI